MDNERQLQVSITFGTIVRTTLFLLFLAFLFLVRDIVLVILTSIVIASSIEPATRWFKKYRVPRVPAVIVMYFVIFALLIGLFYFFIPPLFESAAQLASSLPTYFQSLNFFDPFNGQSIPGDVKAGLVQTFSLKDIADSIQKGIATFSGNFFETASIIFGGAFSFILIIVLSFYFAVRENGIDDFLRIVTPVQHEKYVIGLWTRAQAKIGLWMQGQLLLGLIVGVLTYLGLTILGIKYAFLFAVLAAVFELIPLFGPILSAVPPLIFGFLDGPTTGFMVLGFFIILQQFENHLIYPLVVKKIIGVPPLLVIIALIVGGRLAGFLGLLLAVPLATSLMEFTNDIARRKNLFGTEKGNS
jgi:predicted PurR-regulated permease PerM